jgi:hypothetical protein
MGKVLINISNKIYIFLLVSVVKASSAVLCIARCSVLNCAAWLGLWFVTLVLYVVIAVSEELSSHVMYPEKNWTECETRTSDCADVCVRAAVQTRGLARFVPAVSYARVAELCSEANSGIDKRLSLLAYWSVLRYVQVAVHFTLHVLRVLQGALQCCYRPSGSSRTSWFRASSLVLWSDDHVRDVEIGQACCTHGLEVHTKWSLAQRGV